MPEDQTSADGAARHPCQVQGFNARIFFGEFSPGEKAGLRAGIISFIDSLTLHKSCIINHPNLRFMGMGDAGQFLPAI